MSLQKKNDLLRSHLAVGLFWFITLFLFVAGFNLKALASSMTYAILVVAGGFTIGVTIWATFDLLRRDSVLAKNSAHSVRGASVTIGDPPVAVEPPRGKVSESMLSSRFHWWGAYSRKHPKHASAFLAVFSVMYATPRLPASPVQGGHGGATLIEHSFNVVDTMLQMAPSWAYKGHRNKKGEVTFPLLDSTKTEFRFHSGDPIIPLAAFAHDIGKTACYQMQSNQSVVEVRKNHDIEGAKIMRTLPEVMALPWSDRMAVLTACEFYHHVGSLPYSTWIDDRARALIELLIAADVATGQREGGVMVGEYEDPDLSTFRQPQHTQASETGFGDDAGDDENDGLDAPNPQHEGRSAQQGGPGAEANGTALDLAYSVLLEPGRVNGANVSNRVAWKSGEWLYISDAKLRSSIATMTGDSDYNMLPHRGNMHPFTLELMAQLASNGNLLQEHNGQKFSEKRALYTTRSAVPGKTPVDSKFVLVANVRAFPGLENAADCKAPPEIVGCSWGEKAAINKSAGSREEDGDTSRNVAGDEDEEAVTLLRAAEEMRIPFVERILDGEGFVFFEEEVVRQEFPGFTLSGACFIKKSGGKSGKNFVGTRKRA